MQKIYLITFFFLMFCKISLAKTPPKDSLNVFKQFNFKTNIYEDCDACGCAVNNNSIAVDGLLNKQYIGIKYFSQQYKVKENIFVKEPTENQYYQSIQLLGKIPLSKKIILHLVVPYNINTKESSPREKIKGLGDITVLANYYLINNRINTKNSPHRLLANVGIKIPTGKFDGKNATGVNPSFQLGSGSWDVLTSINYQYIKEAIAMQLGTDYIFKNENAKNYKFGNQWNGSITGYYFFMLGVVKVNPKMGVISEIYQSNKQLGNEIPKTSGEIFFGKAGLEINYYDLTFGIDISSPFYSNLANQEIKPISRFSAFVTFNF